MSGSSRLKISSPLIILALLSTVYALSLFQRVNPSVMAPQLMESFSIDASSFSLISSATMLGYAITQIPSGLLADFMGGRKCIALYQILSGLFCILFTFCGSLIPAVACRFLLGLVLAGNVPAYKILAAKVPADRYALYCSVLTGSGAIGTLMAASPLVSAMALVGWRAALLAVGIFTIFLGCAVGLLVDDGAPASEPSLSAGEKLGILWKGLAEVARMKNFWLIFIWFMFVIGNYFIVLTTWWGSYLMQGNGLSPEAAGLSISIMSLVPIPFMLLFPWLSDNVVHSRKLFLTLSALIQALLFGYLSLQRSEPLGFVELSITGVVFIFCTNCMGPISFTMLKESVPSSALASACGFLNTSAPICAALFQGVFGTILSMSMAEGSSSMASYGNAFLLLLAGSIIALVASLFMKDTISRAS